MFKYQFRILVAFIVLLVLALAGGLMAQGAQKVTGTVFLDSNHNGSKDDGEQGVSGVAVSNQIAVVLTDKHGRYELPVRDEMIVFISKPAGYDLPLDENNLPRFYYIHQPGGSPGKLARRGIKPGGTLPDRIDFALYDGRVQQRFSALIVGDPQPRDSTEVGYFRDDIVADMAGKDAAFYLALGDITFDNLDNYRHYNQVVSQLGIPAYNVPGNHDENYRAPSDRYALETFKSIYGPPYYSFNEGRVHFMVLDDVDYLGWDTKNNRSRGYRGYISDEQLEWIKNDLEVIPDDYLIVLTMHIPLFTLESNNPGVNVVNRQKLFQILQNRPHLLAVSGHMHFIEHLDFPDSIGWQGASVFHSINAGAGCGAWWSGPKNEQGIPLSYCMDGTPNGYFIFEFDGNRFRQRFIPAKHKESHQMRIFSPAGVVSQSALDSLQIVVNIFNAGPNADVFFQIDNNVRQRLANRRMADPFMTDYLERNREYFPGWLGGVTVSSHVWVAALPKNLKPGSHILRISASDGKGNIFSGVRLFDIGK